MDNEIIANSLTITSLLERETSPEVREKISRARELIKMATNECDKLVLAAPDPGKELYPGYSKDLADSTMVPNPDATERIKEATQAVGDAMCQNALCVGLIFIELHSSLKELLKESNPSFSSILQTSQDIYGLARKGITDSGKTIYLLLMLSHAEEYNKLKNLIN